MTSLCVLVSFSAHHCCWQAANEALAAIPMVCVRRAGSCPVLLTYCGLSLHHSVSVPEGGNMSWRGAESVVAGSYKRLTDMLAVCTHNA